MAKPKAKVTMEWHPIEYRRLTEKEQKEYAEQTGVGIEEILDCPMPEDGEEVLVTTTFGDVDTDIFLWETDGGYFENFDICEIAAWMRLPDAYGKEKE